MCICVDMRGTPEEDDEEGEGGEGGFGSCFCE